MDTRSTGIPQTRQIGSENASWISRYCYGASLAAVVAGGIILRLDHLGRSLWTREAWVANSVVAGSLSQMFYYDRWLQTTPPGFLVMVREAVRILGLSNYSLRAVPCLFNVIALLLMAILARRVFQPAFAVLCTTLVALSPVAIANARELKQYSTDLMATCVLLLLLWAYTEATDRRHFTWMCLAFVILMPLSYTVVVFVPLAVVLLLRYAPTDALTARRREVCRRCSILVGAVLILNAVNYVWFVRPNTSRLLADFWQGGFPPRHFNGEMVRFWMEHFVAMGCSFYVPAESTFKDALKTVVLSLPVYVQIGALVAAVAVVWALIGAFRVDHRYRLALLSCLVPVLTLSVLNLLRLYPVGSRRLTLFVFPCIALATAAAIEALWSKYVRPRLPAIVGGNVLRVGAASCAAVVLAVGAHGAGWAIDLTEPEDTEAALRYLKAHVRPARDIVYVHASIEEPVRLYLGTLRWRDAPVYFGHTGFPCCKRTEEPRPTQMADITDYVAADVGRALRGTQPERLWLIFTGRAEHWRYLGADEAGIIAGVLREAGWSKESELRFDNEFVEEFAPAGPPSGTTNSQVNARAVGTRSAGLTRLRNVIDLRPGSALGKSAGPR